MRSILSPRARRWIGASALAIIAGIGGGLDVAQIVADAGETEEA